MSPEQPYFNDFHEDAEPDPIEEGERVPQQLGAEQSAELGKVIERARFNEAAARFEERKKAA